LEVIIPVLGDGCWVLRDGYWVLSLYKTILLEEIIPYMWMNLILLTTYVFNGRTFTIPTIRYWHIYKKKHNFAKLFTNHL